MADNKSYVKDVMDILEEELATIMGKDPDFYSKFNIVLSNEQQYVKMTERKPRTIYIVVKFLSAQLNFGYTNLPININAVGEENGIEVCQRLLLEFGQEYNLNDEKRVNNDIVKQIYTSPQVMANFNEVYKGFRSLFYMSGTFLIGTDSNSITNIEITRIDSEVLVDKDDKPSPETVNFLQSNWGWHNQLDSQAFTGTNNRTVSKAKISTLSVNVVVYLQDNRLCNTLLGMAWDKQTFNHITYEDGQETVTENDTAAPNKNKTVFYLNLTFKNGFAVTNMPFYVADVSGSQNIGEFPAVSVTFTN